MSINISSINTTIICDAKFCFRSPCDNDALLCYCNARKLFARLAACKAFDVFGLSSYEKMSFYPIDITTHVKDVPNQYLHYIVVAIEGLSNTSNWFEYYGIDAIIDNRDFSMDADFPGNLYVNEGMQDEGKCYSFDVYKKLCKYFDCIFELKSNKLPSTLFTPTSLEDIKNHRIIMNNDGEILLEETATQPFKNICGQSPLSLPYSNPDFGKKTLEEVLGDEAIPAKYHVASDFLT